MMPQLPLRAGVTMVMSALLMALSGCGTTSYKVKVDAVAKHDNGKPSEAQSFKIRNKNPAVDEGDLRYKEAAEYVRTALSGKGLYEAPNAESADMIVDLDYGVDSPRTKIETVSVPVYAQVGGGVRYEQVTTTNARGVSSTRTVAVMEPPRTELVGFDDVPREVVVYEKYLRITAVENKTLSEGKPAPQIWSVHASTEDESKDIRKYLPIIATATVDYIDRDSDASKVVKVYVPSPTVAFIQKGMDDKTVAVADPAPKP